MATRKRKKGALYFTSIAIVGEQAAILLGSYYALEDADEPRTALLSLRRGVWRGMDLSGVCHAVRSRPLGGGREDLLLERNRGLYRVEAPAGVRFERIFPRRRGFLMDLRSIDAVWYAVGGHQQIYRSSGTTWQTFDEGVYRPGPDGEAKLLLSIDGRSGDNLYAVGYGGVIFHCDGTTWTRMPSPTNVGLQRVLCVGDDVYVCGNAMTLYRGRNTQWISLSEPGEGVFWDMAWFKGRLYVCTKQKLYVLVDDQLEEVPIGVERALGFYRMDASATELWTCGNECVLRFDGKKWTQYPFPDND